MTTTTTFQGMEPGAKNSSRVLRPPGGASNISFGTDEDKPPARKNKMASNIFAGPDDPHAHRRNNPPGGTPSGVLCGEPSAPLRRCQQPPLFPEELTDTPNAAAGGEEYEQANDVDCAEEPEAVQEQKEEESPQPSAPSGAAPAPAASGRRNPPGGKSSLILG